MTNDTMLIAKEELLTIPAISLHTPWAYWVHWGWKRIETRTHNRFAGLKGKRIAIHAAQTQDKKALTLAEHYLTPTQRDYTVKKQKGLMGSGLICTAMVSDYRVLTGDDSAQAMIDCVEKQRFGLFLTDIRHLIPNIYIPGRQGIFHVQVPESAVTGPIRYAGMPPIDGQHEEDEHCPLCNAPITEGDMGYGLAFGGMGTYWSCSREGCQWFYKVMDNEGIEASGNGETV